MKNKKITIGADIGGGHIFSAAFDNHSNTIIEKSRCYTKVNRKGSAQEIVSAWSENLLKTISKISLEHLKGIAIAMPGPFNYKTGVAKFEINDKFEKLNNVNVREEITKLLGVTNIPIRFVNDATAFAIGVGAYGEASSYKRVVVITLGTGIGSAFLDNGVPIVNRSDVPKLGCLWHLPYKTGIVDDYFSTRWFVNEFNSRTSKGVTGVDEIAELTKEYPEAKAIFQEFGNYLADFIGPWLKKFNSDLVVFGGGVTKSFNLFEPMFQNTLSKSGIHVDLKVSSQMEDAVVMASSKIFQESFWEIIKHDLPDN